MEVFMENNTNKKVNLNDNTMVENLCNWTIYFGLKNAFTKDAEMMIPANSSRSLLNNEIVSQIQDGNVFFVGTDGKGSHARVYIDNTELRQLIGFESEDGKIKQNIISPEKCQKLFDYKTQSTFESKIKEEIITEHEKDYIMSYARKNKINDFEKISFLIGYCNRPFKI
jgi:hypothetical protein